jgi:hypothetical protein
MFTQVAIDFHASMNAINTFFLFSLALRYSGSVQHRPLQAVVS